jgi:hypothetical protein
MDITENPRLLNVFFRQSLDLMYYNLIRNKESTSGIRDVGFEQHNPLPPD